MKIHSLKMTKETSGYYELWAVLYVFLLFLCVNEIGVSGARLTRQTTSSQKIKGKIIFNFIEI